MGCLSSLMNFGTKYKFISDVSRFKVARNVALSKDKIVPTTYFMIKAMFETVPLCLSRLNWCRQCRSREFYYTMDKARTNQYYLKQNPILKYWMIK